MSFASKSSIAQLPEPEIGYRQLFMALIRRKFWLLGVFTAAVIGSLLFSLRQETTYESSMRLIVEPNYRQDYDPAEADRSPSDRERETDYVTQLNLMRSNDLLAAAAEVLTPVYQDLSAADIGQSLTIRRVQEDGVETRIVNVSYVDDSPERAQQVLAALKEVYQQYTLEQQAQRLNRGLESINTQLESAEQSLADSQRDLKQFRISQNIVDPQLQADSLTETLNDIVQRRYDQQEAYEAAQAQYETLRQQLALTPGEAFQAARLSQSPRVQSLLAELQGTEIQLAERRGVYMDADPGVAILVAQQENQLALLREESRRVLGDRALDSTGLDFQDFSQLSELDLNLVEQLAAMQGLIDSLAAQNKVLTQTERTVRAELSQFPDLIATYDRLQPEIETEQSVLRQLLTQRELLSAELARGGFSWQVVASPDLGRAIEPDLRRNLVIGAVLGLFLGSLAAFIRESADETIRTPEQIRQYSRLPLLGVIEPRSVPNSLLANLTRSGEDVATLERTLRPFRASLDLLFKHIQRSASPECQSLVVVPLVHSESRLGLWLAICAARLGQKVAYIEADLQHAVVSERLNIDMPDDNGLSGFLRSPIAEACLASVKVWGATVDILPAGPTVNDIAGLLSSPRLNGLIRKLEKHYDFVIVDAPMMGTADALEVTSVGRGNLLVADLNRVSQTDLQQLSYTFEGVNDIGIVASSPEAIGRANLLLSHIAQSQQRSKWVRVTRVATARNFVSQDP